MLRRPVAAHQMECHEPRAEPPQGWQGRGITGPGGAELAVMAAGVICQPRLSGKLIIK